MHVRRRLRTAVLKRGERVSFYDVIFIFMANLDFIRFCFPSLMDLLSASPLAVVVNSFFGELVVVGELAKAAGCVCNASSLCGDRGNMRGGTTIVATFVQLS